MGRHRASRSADSSDSTHVSHHLSRRATRNRRATRASSESTAPTGPRSAESRHFFGSDHGAGAAQKSVTDTAWDIAVYSETAEPPGRRRIHSATTQAQQAPQAQPTPQAQQAPRFSPREAARPSHTPETPISHPTGIPHMHSHAHSHDRKSNRIEGWHTWHPWRWVLMIFIVAWIAVTAFGLARMWPGSSEPTVSEDFYSAFPLGAQQEKGTVVSTSPGECSSPDSGTVFGSSPRVSLGAAQDCTWVIVGLDSGPDAGSRTLLINSGLPGEPDLQAGDQIKVQVSTDNLGQRAYSFADYQRATPLLVWGVVILIAILLLAGLSGVRSLIGLAFTIAVVVFFTLPALLAGFSPTAIAVISGALMLLPTVFLVHGWNWKAASSLGGTLAALAIAALLAYLAIEHAHLRGLGDDENLQILRFLPEVSVTGILLCGFIIGALGVLNDVTVAQASTVNELAELDPATPPLRLFVGAMKVGRDHITSMVYTLVLTYTGASLPILLLLAVADRPLGQTLTSDIMATELLRTGVGALALTLAVPLTTLFAAYTVPNRQPRR